MNLTNDQFSRLTYKGVLFIITNNQIFVILSKINHLLSPFYDPKHPTIQSKMFICNISKETFITTIDQLKKVAFIKINEDLCYLWCFN
jgi:hypothetical protein